MVRIAEHRGETSESFSMEEEDASSTPQSSGHSTLGVAAMHPARRHTPGLASRTPTGDTPAGALSAARELLRHLPSLTASPGAMRQWCGDVDPSPWRGALWLGQTQASIVLALARSIYLGAHVLSKDCPDWRSMNEA
jgi:hypothetical protein